LGSKADAETDEISVEGKSLSRPNKKFHYYAYYKPRGLMVTKRDDFGRATIFDKIELAPEVNYVGRLDRDSEGLLLLTDDGDFLQKYTHPRFEVGKVYHVQLSRPLLEAEAQSLLEGVRLEGRPVRARRIQRRRGMGKDWVEIELGEGMKREIRRMMELFRIKVLRLIRVRHGSVELGDLKSGEMIELKKRPR